MLFISADPVGPEMAGVGIRYWELAQVLAPHAEVTLAAIQVGEMPDAGIAFAEYEPHDPRALRAQIARADLVVCQPQWPVVTAWLSRARCRVVYDLYDPEAFETIELFEHRRPALRKLMVSLAVDRLGDALRTGDHFLCASEKQRDLWLGAMYGGRLIDARNYDRDPSFRSIIDVVPFGLPAEPPAAPAQDPIRRAIPAIGPDDEVVLWNGGIWNWLDPVTAVRAFAQLIARRPRAKLVFMGGSSNPAGQRASEEARRAAEETGQLDRTVFFNASWVPYAERAGWLLGAECSLSTHEEHLETRFAFRTRLLDCFWAGLPIVCSEGDELAERVRREDLGEAVPPRDEQALAEALERVLSRGRASYGQALAAVAAQYEWPRVGAPLVRMLEEGDAGGLHAAGTVRAGLEHRARSLAYRVSHRAIRRGFAVARRLGVI